MFLRYLRVVARRVLGSRPIMLLVIALAVLNCLPLGDRAPDGYSFEGREVEDFRATVYDDPTESMLYPSQDGTERMRLLWERDVERNELIKQMIAAYDAGDMTAYYASYAEYAECYLGVGGYSQYAEVDAAWYRALAESEAERTYASTGDMPGTLYLVADGKYLLFPLIPYLPFLSTTSDGYGLGYDGSYDYLLWLLPIAAVSIAAASLQARGRLATQLPASPRRRFLMASLATALVSLGMLAIIVAPGFIWACARNGVGGLTYPVMRIAFTTIEAKAVGAVLFETAALYALIALAFSLLAHLSAALLKTVMPALLLMVSAAASTLMPGFYGGALAIDDFAAYLPWAYLRVGYAVGAPSVGNATEAITCGVPGMGFALGAATLGLMAAALFAVLMLAATFAGEGLPSPERRLSLPGGLSLLPSAKARRSPVRDYTLALFRMVLSARWLYALAALMAVAMLAPALFSIRLDVGSFSVKRYREGDYRKLQTAEVSGAFAEGTPEADDLAKARELLFGFVSGSGRAEQFRALAAYERFRIELAKDDSPVLSQVLEVDSASFDAVRAEARAALLDRVAELPEPDVYALSELMPGSFYLSFIYGTLPFAFWLVPGVAAALAVVALRTRGGFMQQAPVSFGTELFAGCLVAFVLAVAMLLAVAIPGTVAATARNGIGELGYPVIFVQSGAVVASTVGRALLQGAISQLLVTGLVVAMILAAGHLARSFRAACIAAAVGLVLAALAVNASALAAGEGVLSLALGWLPFTYFDVARTVGAATYDVLFGVGASVLAGWISVGAAIPLVLVVCRLVMRVRASRMQVPPRLTTVQRI